MRLLSSILQRAVYPALGKLGYFHARASAAIVTYHGVLPSGYRSPDSFLDNTLVSIDAFRSHLRLLKRQYSVISPERFLGWVRGSEELPAHAVLLTCDDGLLNNSTVMLPVLQEEGLRCLFFVTGVSADENPELLWYVQLYLMLMESRGKGRAFEWHGMTIPGIGSDAETRRAQWLRLMSSLSCFSPDARADFMNEAVRCWGLDPAWKQRYLDDPLLRPRFRLLGASAVRQLAEAGMTIGAHTMTHPALSQQPADLARQELTSSRQQLQKCTGQPVWALAYPFGNPSAVGAREYEFAREAGYECAFMNVPGKLLGASKFALPRVHVTAEMSLSVYEAHVSGVHEALRNRLRSIHSIGERGRE
ncbi:MAG TPA: polysaccharide deacetylase family protein [Candidatus Dormibacteraeota bacterium]|nr:polysaccharide deacetylase family protein [Candidatus Dormibacteraeota bacterium]